MATSTASSYVIRSPAFEHDAGVGDREQLGHPPVRDGKDVLPGLRVYDGRPSNGVDDVREVIKLLSAANIPACIVGVNALRYYGAGRVTWEWDVCVPTHKLEDAESIFEENEMYERAKPPPPVTESFRHLSPIFQLKAVGFFFILTPSSQCFVDPQPEHCEVSKGGVPYPKMAQFARSLLVLQGRSNLNDFIDGMDLDEKWGQENLDFDELQIKGIEFTKSMNVEFAARNLGQYNINVDYRKIWNEAVTTKPKRIEPMKQGRYKTRWRRIKNDTDPRTRNRRI